MRIHSEIHVATARGANPIKSSEWPPKIHDVPCDATPACQCARASTRPRAFATTPTSAPCLRRRARWRAKSSRNRSAQTRVPKYTRTRLQAHARARPQRRGCPHTPTRRHAHAQSLAHICATLRPNELIRLPTRTHAFFVVTDTCANAPLHARLPTQKSTST